MEMPLRGEVVLNGEDSSLLEALQEEDDFTIRRAVERLREGLFDPVAVRLLTAHEEWLRDESERGFRAVDAGKSPHLCIVGAYGQGKSHSLAYIQELALREGFAASLINLDPREVPFRQFREVYRELMAHLRLPDAVGSFPARWSQWAQEQTRVRGDLRESLVELLPDRMPHLFKSVLVAMANGSFSLSNSVEQAFQPVMLPREFLMLPARALHGETISAYRLRNIFKHLQVPFYKDRSLSCRGVGPYFDMTQALSCLFRQMGYRGWVLLFDEGESIVQASVVARSKSYGLLHRLFAPDVAEPAFLYPVFAFTDDFFERVRQEDYDQVKVRGGVEMPYFDRDYAKEWQDLNIYRLHDLSREEWVELSRKLVHLHARAYRWRPPHDWLAQEMVERLDAKRTQETRLKLKALVDCLDLAHQEQVL